MSTVEEELRLAKRRLVLRDSLAFFSLTVISVVLFVLTWALFQSFSEHRVDLANRWYSRGQADMAAHHPEQAITSLHAALSYAPDKPEYQLLLAEALAQAGNYDEALAYFSNLWEAQPGSGPLNLQLARLSSQRKRPSDAVRYYRASIYGTWEGDGTERRREVRLELIRYLMDAHDLTAAQNELLIAAGNVPDDLSRLEIAKLMVDAGDSATALTQYEKVLATNPSNIEARQDSAEVAFQMGRYATVVKLLGSEEGRALNSPAAEKLFDQARSVLALSPAESLPAAERVRRILRLRQIVQARWDACQAKLNVPSAERDTLPPRLLIEVQALSAQWKNEDIHALRADLGNDSNLQQKEIEIIYRTEDLANQTCGAATGDDELVTLLAKSAGTVGQ
jgi:tetratricopeptide (TPR) repeat protein